MIIRHRSVCGTILITRSRKRESKKIFRFNFKKRKKVCDTFSLISSLSLSLSLSLSINLSLSFHLFLILPLFLIFPLFLILPLLLCLCLSLSSLLLCLSHSFSILPHLTLYLIITLSITYFLSLSILLSISLSLHIYQYFFLSINLYILYITLNVFPSHTHNSMISSLANIGRCELGILGGKRRTSFSFQCSNNCCFNGTHFSSLSKPRAVRKIQSIYLT